MSRIEQYARECLCRAGITGFPRLEGLERIAAYTRRIRIHYRSGRTHAFCRLCLDGTADIWVAPGALECLGHEMAHCMIRDPKQAAYTGHMPAWLRAEERFCNQLSRAILLPSPLMDAPDWEIAEASGCRRVTIRLRRVDLDLAPAPAWELHPRWQRGIRRIARRYRLNVTVDDGPPQYATAAEVQAMLEAFRVQVAGRAIAR